MHTHNQNGEDTSGVRTSGFCVFIDSDQMSCTYSKSLYLHDRERDMPTHKRNIRNEMFIMYF